MRNLSSLLIIVITLVLTGCGGGTQRQREASPAVDKRAAIKNTGGMWMPHQMKQHAERLRDLGFQMDAKTLSDPLAHPLGAIVSLGGCSASFVSANGLIITNHHCVQQALGNNSTPAQNLVKEGYAAKSMNDEKSAGPSARVYVTQAVNDVTAQLLKGISLSDSGAADYNRIEAIERRIKHLTQECEKGRVGIRCSVRSFYNGAKYYRIEQLEIRDVRLVYAPSKSVGAFGGDIDNWRWPRHCGDYAFLRAYVARNGEPSGFARENVPYRPNHHLKVASQPLEETNPVLAAGYPGVSNRIKTLAEMQDAVEWRYPRLISIFQQQIALLEALSKGNEELAIKANSTLMGLRNYLPNYQAILTGLTKQGIVDLRRAEETAFKNWISADAVRRARYGGVFRDLEDIRAKYVGTRDKDAAFHDIVSPSRMGNLLTSALTIVRMAEERPKADEERLPSFQQRNWPKLRNDLESFQKTYDRRLDLPVLKMYVKRATDMPSRLRPEAVRILVGDGVDKEAAIEQALSQIYQASQLEDKETRLTLFNTATPQSLEKSKDAWIQKAREILPLVKALEIKEKTYNGALLRVMPHYIAALTEFKRGFLAADANGTLRVTFGTVQGYRPRPTAPLTRAFTLASEVLAKDTGTEPFNSPLRLLNAIRTAYQTGRKGPYASKALGNEIPVNFLADLDITGGNSGSATLNAKGELVGLVFDGNIESLASDWYFMPEMKRSIHVDLRYVLWIMDAVDRVHWLLQEMGVSPSFGS